jgi:hypothetical protein
MRDNANTGYFIKPGQTGPTPGVGNTSTNPYFPTQGSPTTITALPTTWQNTAGNTGKKAEVRSAIMLHREAFVLAMLQEPKTEMSRETLYLADAIVTSTLYGARDYRPECAVVIHTNGEIPQVA